MSLEYEKQTITAMIRLFCKLTHKSDSLCNGCTDLSTYALKRLEMCPFGEEKPVCRKCHVHCYSMEMRERITGVMRFAGPRMILYHPVMAFRHMIHLKRPAKS